MQIQPMRDLVLIRRSAPDAASSGGLIIPELAQVEKYQGQVVAVGPGRRNRKGEPVPLGVAVGDRVLFNSYSGSDIDVNGETHIIMGQNDLIAILG